jgi:hypothetical protein
MFKKIFWCTYLFVAVNIIWGCMVLPFVPVVGTVYEGYDAWRGREAVKYYNQDIVSIHQAVMQSSRQLNLKTVRKPLAKGKKGYALVVQCKEPLQISILRFEKKVTKVVIKTAMFGDKQFTYFFYQRIDANLARMRASTNSNYNLASR